jgi:choline dehydrogenase-like flavoprotein
VVSEGIRIKDYSRERVLGGASTTWSGLSSPLDEADMRERPYLRHSGWPVSRDELMPYYTRAAGAYRFAGPELFADGAFASMKERGDVRLGWTDVEEKIFLAASEPQDFGREWKHVFEAEGLDLWLDATLLRLEGGGEGDRVREGVLRSRGGREVRVEADVFVLATGGLENARLLLTSTDLCAAGLGNARDQVGRYLMNHPKNYHGLVKLTRPVRDVPYHFGFLHKGYAGYAGLRLHPDVQQREELLNAYVRFEPLFPWSGNQGVEALVFLVKHSAGFLRRWKQRREDDVVTLRDYSETGDDSDLQNERKTAWDWVKLGGLVIVNALPVTRYAWSRLREGRAPTIHNVRIRNFMEMEPDPENRVVLGERLDPDGRRVPVVRHQTTARDRASLVALHRVLAEELAANGFGELSTDLAEADPWPIDLDASHHMGTTRMGTDPATSVVDRDCRLHDVDNVYLAGASVFPTSGSANPTFTLVALAIRLADHLRGRLGGPR